MATTYHDPDGRVAAYVLQGRTDDSGVEAEGEHVDGQDLRLLSQFLTAGVKDAAAFQVRERQAGATMSVDVGSGAVGDVAVIAGADPLQGNYIVGWPEAVTNVPIAAADLLNPRIDEIYLVVQDHTYDNNGANIVPRLAVRDGTPSSSPTPPGPDASWKAYLLLATVDVGAGVTVIEDDDIIDRRTYIVADSAGGGFAPTGSIMAFAGTTAPDGWLMCTGQAVSRTTFKRLFAVLGTTYGPGDGSTTFNLPDLRQRFPLGKAASGTGSTLGATGGAIDHTHSGPSHTHSMSHAHSMAHSHQVDPPATWSEFAGEHDHQLQFGAAVAGGSDWSAITDSDGNHRHSVNIAAFTSGGSSASNTGGSSA